MADAAPSEGSSQPLAPPVDGPGEEGEECLKKRKNPKWLPLESNPKILSGFFERVGVLGDWSFTDVLGLVPELLSFVPKPAVAVCVFFPWLEVLGGQEASRRAPAPTFYLIQHKEFGSACGTIAAVHAIGNLDREGVLQLTPESPMARFLARVDGRSPEDFGRELADVSDLHEVSEQAAKSRGAQTRTPGRDDKVDGHVAVFVQVQGRLVELDGCVGFPNRPRGG